MKNKFIALALVTLSIATTTVSCTADEAKEPIKKSATAFSNVTMDLKTENGATAKNVNRGDLHAWISEVDVTVHSDDFNYADKMTPFTLVNSGGDAGYNLETVALGMNDFTVVTKTNSPQSLTWGTTTSTPTAKIEELKGLPVYAIYNAKIENFKVESGANTLPQTMLTTQQGRIMGVFTLSQNLKDLGVTAVVTPATTLVMPSTNALEGKTINPTTNASFYMSSVYATNGATMNFTVVLKDKNGNPFKTLNTSLTVAASKSVNTIFTIEQSGITLNTASDVFTAQPWVDQDGGVTVGN